MKNNPLFIWFGKYLLAKRAERKNKSKHLSIGHDTVVKNSEFGVYVKIYNYSSVVDSEMGNYSYVGNRSHIRNTKIGAFCTIGPDCQIGMGLHPVGKNVSIHPIFYSDKKQSGITFADKSYFKESERITIGNDVWIGAAVKVMDGVAIGNGVVIATGAVVTKDVPPYSIVGGIPAKVIRYRFNEKQINKLEEIKWWNFSRDELRNNFKLFHDVDKFFDHYSKGVNDE